MAHNFSIKRRNFLLGLTAFSGAVAASQLPLKKALGQTSINGAGASFPAPLYQRWFSEYNKINSGVQISYQSVGSGAGVKNFIEGITDFGASDVAMTDEEIAQVNGGVVLLPMTAGSIVVGYNVPGAEIQLTREQLVGVFMGKITNWSEIGGPDLPITIIHRSDGSGTTAVFTSHLTAISSDWANQVGTDKTVNWPTGIGGKGNEGVSAAIQQTEGALGYIEYGYAKQLNIPTARLQNKNGDFVEANPENASQSLAQVELPENLRAFVTDPDGQNSYPIVTYTWILAHQKYDNPNIAEEFKKAMIWCLNDGQQFSSELGYIPLPPNVVERVTAAVNTIS